MNIIDAIKNRRSIRKFLKKEIDKETIANILKAGIDAPSPKNRQPWKFVVVSGRSKHELIHVMSKGIEKAKADLELVLDVDQFLSSAKTTLEIMEEAPIIIFVINTDAKAMQRQTPFKRFVEMSNIQSIGAVVENMLLASLEYGIGGLWISDIYFTIAEIGEWLNTNKQIVAAAAFGYPAEIPPPKPRKKEDELVEWRIS